MSQFLPTKPTASSRLSSLGKRHLNIDLEEIMATKAKKTVVKKAATKKTAARAKTIPIRSKDKKKLAGSISLGGKKSPTAKKAVAKKAATPKVAVSSIKKIVIKKVSMPTTLPPKAFAPVAKKVYAPLPEIEEIAHDRNDDDYTMDTYLKDLAPLPKDFVSTFSVDNVKELNTSRGIAWTADIIRDGEVVGTAENRGDGGANYYTFDDSEIRDAWESEAAEAYADTMHEGQDEEDTLFSYLDLLADR